MNTNDQTLFIQILAQSLISDAVLADQERAYLDRIMDSFEMSDGARREALSQVSLDSPVEERVQALSEQSRGELLQEVQKAINVDGELSNAEAAFIDRIRAVLG